MSRLTCGPATGSPSLCAFGSWNPTPTRNGPRRLFPHPETASGDLPERLKQQTDASIGPPRRGNHFGPAGESPTPRRLRGAVEDELLRRSYEDVKLQSGTRNLHRNMSFEYSDRTGSGIPTDVEIEIQAHSGFPEQARIGIDAGGPSPSSAHLGIAPLTDSGHPGGAGFPSSADSPERLAFVTGGRMRIAP
jgi:hypothetical protein